MATRTYKTLGAIFPAAATLSIAYTVPTGKTAVLSNIHVCNQSATPDKFRIVIIKATDIGGGVTAKNYVAYDVDIDGNDPVPCQLGATLGAGDQVRVYSLNGTLSFNIFGFEYSA